MQFTPAGASAAHQKLGAGPPDRPVEATSAGGAPERVHVHPARVREALTARAQAHEADKNYDAAVVDLRACGVRRLPSSYESS